MSNNTSDVEDRRLLFDNLLADFDQTLTPEIQQVLGDEVVRLMQNAVPVGLDADRRVVMPEDYDMNAAPAVLMLKPYEPTNVDVGPAEYEALVQSSVRFGFEFDDKPSEHRVSILPQYRALVLPVVIDTVTTESQPPEGAVLPAVMVVAPGLFQSRAGLQTYVSGHEFRHWRDLVVEPLGHNGPEATVALEKAAFLPGFLLAQHLQWTGQYAMPELDQLTELAYGLPPETGAHTIRTAVHTARKRNPLEDHQDPYIYSTALAATALSKAYGDVSSALVTSDEGDAYRSCGLSSR